MIHNFLEYEELVQSKGAYSSGDSFSREAVEQSEDPGERTSKNFRQANELGDSWELLVMASTLIAMTAP